MSKNFKKKNFFKYLFFTFILAFFLIFIWLYFNIGIFNKLIFYPSLIFPHRQYLILLQNNYELRPTGGFISAYAKIKFFLGIPIELKFGDSYEIDHTNPDLFSGGKIIKAPDPIEKLLNNPKYKGWTFRDSNFDPDFKKSAEKAIEFYNIMYPNEKIDGVIAINMSFFEDLLGIIDQINVDKYVLNKNNFFQIVQFESKNIDLHNINDLKNRKNFIKDFYTKGIKNLFLNPFKWPFLADFLYNQFEKKNIQAYFKDQDLNNFFEEKGWNGDIDIKPIFDIYDNFLYINGANYGGRKSDRYISRNIDRYIYHSFSGNIIHNKVSFKLYHNGSKAHLSNVYIGYYRIFVPKNAINIIASKDVEIADYNDKFKYIGFIVKMDPLSSYNIDIEYDILSIKNDYKVIYKKQSGILNESYNLYIHAPIEFNILSDNINVYENTAIYKAIPLKDTINTYSLHLNKTPLMIIYQDFDINTKRIEIRYDRWIDINEAINTGNYIITDKNIVNKDIDDKKLDITKIEYHEDFVYLWCENATTQKEEHFNIQIKNQKDRIGNKLYPDPKNITVIMR